MLLTSILKMNSLWDMEDDFGLPDRVATISIRIFVAKLWWDSMFYIFFFWNIFRIKLWHNDFFLYLGNNNEWNHIYFIIYGFSV